MDLPMASPHLVSSGILVSRFCPRWKPLVRYTSHLCCVSRAQLSTRTRKDSALCTWPVCQAEPLPLVPASNSAAPIGPSQTIAMVEGRGQGEPVRLSTSPLLSDALVSSPASLLDSGVGQREGEAQRPCPSQGCRSLSSQDFEAIHSAKNPQYKIPPHLRRGEKSETTQARGRLLWRECRPFDLGPARASEGHQGVESRGSICPLLMKHLWLSQLTPIQAAAEDPQHRNPGLAASPWVARLWKKRVQPGLC